MTWSETIVGDLLFVSAVALGVWIADWTVFGWLVAGVAGRNIWNIWNARKEAR